MEETFYRYDGVNLPLREIIPRYVRGDGAGVTGAARRFPAAKHEMINNAN